MQDSKRIGVGGIVNGPFSPFGNFFGVMVRALEPTLDLRDIEGAFPHLGIFFEVDGSLGSSSLPVAARLRYSAKRNEIALRLRFHERETREDMAAQVEETTALGLALCADRLQKERKEADLGPFRESIQAFRLRFRELALVAMGMEESVAQKYVRKIYEEVKDNPEKYPLGTKPYFGV